MYVEFLSFFVPKYGRLSKSAEDLNPRLESSAEDLSLSAQDLSPSAEDLSPQ
jgi:hypothetical protein